MHRLSASTGRACGLKGRQVAGAVHLPESGARQRENHSRSPIQSARIENLDLFIGVRAHCIYTRPTTVMAEYRWSRRAKSCHNG
jgi:hypothetical protein